MVYDPITKKVLLFGGYDRTGSSKSAPRGPWAYDSVANTWTPLHPTGAGVYGNRTAVYVPTIKKILCLTGSPPDKDMYAYDPSANTWTKLESSGEVTLSWRSPESRPNALWDWKPMAYDSLTEKVLFIEPAALQFVSAEVAPTQISILAYDPTTNVWEDLRPQGELPHRVDAMVYDPNTDRFFMFGDRGLWVYDSGANAVAELSMPRNSPKGRYGVEMVYHPGSKLIILFGGASDDPLYPEILWGYDPVQETWSQIKPAGRFPYGRENHAMAYDSMTGHIVMFGGINHERGEIVEVDNGGPEIDFRAKPFSDTWLLSTEPVGQ